MGAQPGAAGPIRTSRTLPDSAGLCRTHPDPRLPDKVASRYRHPTVVVASAGGGGGGGIGDFFLRLVSRGFQFQVASRRFPPALYLHLITGAPAPPSVRADCPRRPACLPACLPVCLSACLPAPSVKTPTVNGKKKPRKLERGRGCGRDPYEIDDFCFRAEVIGVPSGVGKGKNWKPPESDKLRGASPQSVMACPEPCPRGVGKLCAPIN
jgi:hypothetical protein